MRGLSGAGLRRPTILTAGLCVLWTLCRIPSPTAFLMYGDWGHQMAGANQMLFGKHPFIDYKAVYGPLVFYASGLAQVAAGQRPIGEIVLAVGAHALAYALLFRLFCTASARPWFAAVLTLFGLVLQPPLYKYYVVLGPVLALTAIWRYIERGDRPSLWLVAASVAFAGLFRPDIGVYAALAAAVVTLGRAGPAMSRIRSTCAFALAVVVCASPWLIWAAVKGGLVRYFAYTVTGSVGIAGGLAVPFPGFDADGPLASRHNATFLSFLVFHALPSLSLLVLWTLRGSLEASTRLGVLSAALLAQGCLVQSMHRADYDHLVQALPLSLVLVAWMAGVMVDRMLGTEGPRHGSAAVLVAGLGALASAVLLGAVDQIQQPTLRPLTVIQRLAVYARSREQFLGTVERLHPGLWIAEMTRYARDHTSPGEHILALPAPLQNVYYFAERPFAGGQITIAPETFATEADQRQLVDRLEQERAALVLDMPLWAFDGQIQRKPRSFAPILWVYITATFPEVKGFGRGVIRTRGPEAGPVASESR